MARTHKDIARSIRLLEAQATLAKAGDQPGVPEGVNAAQLTWEGRTSLEAIAGEIRKIAPRLADDLYPLATAVVPLGINFGAYTPGDLARATRALSFASWALEDASAVRFTRQLTLAALVVGQIYSEGE